MVTDSVFGKLAFIQTDRRWSTEDADFLQTEMAKGTSEPLGHELLREANVNRDSNPRSSLILGVAAAEVGFKQFASKSLPDTAWILELPSPPLIEMLNKFPWCQLNLRINDKVPAVPELIIDELKKAVNLRNKIVHSGIASLSFETLKSALDSVKDLLYFLDMLSGTGQSWPGNLISADVITQLKKH